MLSLRLTTLIERLFIPDISAPLPQTRIAGTISTFELQFVQIVAIDWGFNPSTTLGAALHFSFHLLSSLLLLENGGGVWITRISACAVRPTHSQSTRRVGSYLRAEGDMTPLIALHGVYKRPHADRRHFVIHSSLPRPRIAAQLSGPKSHPLQFSARFVTRDNQSPAHHASDECTCRRQYPTAPTL